MISKSVVLHAVSKPSGHHIVLGSSNLAVVHASLFGERPRFPALHPGCDHHFVIHATTLDWGIPPDVFEALAAEHLTSTGHVLDTDEAIVVDLT
jgi:hypothetical protein